MKNAGFLLATFLRAMSNHRRRLRRDSPLFIEGKRECIISCVPTARIFWLTLLLHSGFEMSANFTYGRKLSRARPCISAEAHSTMTDFRRPRLIAYYLPQFHPIQKTMNGGAMDLRNGRTWQEPNRFPGTLSTAICQQISVFMICGFRKHAERKPISLARLESEGSATGITGFAENGFLNGPLTRF